MAGSGTVCGERVVQWMTKLEKKKDTLSAQNQLANHYEYAAGLGTKGGNSTKKSRGHGDDTTNGLATRHVGVEEDHQESISVWEGAMDSFRYGLM